MTNYIFYSLNNSHLTTKIFKKIYTGCMLMALVITQFPLYSRAEDFPMAAPAFAVESLDINNIFSLHMDDSAKIISPKVKSQIHSRIKLLVNISQLKTDGTDRDAAVPLGRYIAPESDIKKRIRIGKGECKREMKECFVDAWDSSVVKDGVYMTWFRTRTKDTRSSVPFPIIIDNTPPKITLAPYSTALTNQNITVTASTDEGVLNASSYTFTQNGNFDFIATDGAGNTTVQRVTITNIDKQGPVITIAPYIKKKINQDITVNASITEGVLNTSGHTFTGNGSFDFIATDVLGNTTVKTIIIDNIDKEAPIITVFPYFIDPTNQDVVVLAMTNEGVLNASGHTFTGNGSFDFIATDPAGNITTQTITITNIDKQGPVITIAPYMTGMTNQDITVNASITEGVLNASGHTFTGNGSFDFIATDALGNITIQTVTITNIDKESPVIIIDPYMTGMTNQDITVTASTNKGTLNASGHTFTGNGSFEFIVTDALGNTTIQTVTITNIDKISPVITINGEQTIDLIVGNTYTELGAQATDNYDTTGQLAGSVHISSSVNTGAVGSYTVIYTVSDTAGNIAIPVIRIVNVKSPVVSNGGGGGGGSVAGPTKDYCPEGDFSNSYYDGTCGVAKVVTKISSGSIDNNLVGDDGYIPEFGGAYTFAFEHGITSMPNPKAANMTGLLMRIDMAKMMVNYAINVLGKTPDANIICKFTDISDQTMEMRGYAIKACQLGLMSKGKKQFMPNNLVTRDQLGSTLSRMLYATPETGRPYYLVHLNLLKQKGVIKDTNPNIIEARGYAMLMLMRTAQ